MVLAELDPYPLHLSGLRGPHLAGTAVDDGSAALQPPPASHPLELWTRHLLRCSFRQDHSRVRPRAPRTKRLSSQRLRQVRALISISYL